MRQSQITLYLPPDLLMSLDREAALRQLQEVNKGARGGAKGRRSDVVRDALIAYLPPPKPPALSPAVEEALGR